MVQKARKIPFLSQKVTLPAKKMSMNRFRPNENQFLSEDLIEQKSVMVVVEFCNFNI
jgi:hypothetical protein